MGVDGNEDIQQQQALPPSLEAVYQFRAQSLQRSLGEQLQIVSLLEQQLALQAQKSNAEIVKLGQLIASHAARINKLEEENRVLNCRNAGLEADMQIREAKEVHHTTNGQVGDGVYKG